MRARAALVVRPSRGKLVAPDALRFVPNDAPICVDGAPAPAELDLESARRIRIEGKHVVVRMAAQSIGDADAQALGAIVGQPDIFHAVDLQHEVIEALRHRCGNQR